MASTPLTKRRIDALTYPYDPASNKAYYVPDGTISRLYVRVNPSNRKTFVIRYRVNGRKRNLKLGRYGTLTLDEARKVARQKLARVDLGHDPQQERQERAQNVTFDQYADHYVETHVNTLRSARGQLRAINAELRPRWGSRRL